jgi:hypothetical protein
VGRVTFKDSMSFMLSGLGKLVSNLAPEAFVRTRAHILARHGDRSQEWRDEALEMLTRKGVYPYEHMDSYARFEETQLPPIEAFTSAMNGETSAEDYAHGLRVWEHWGCRTMRDYHDLYLLADVILLADVFEAFRGTAQDAWSLDAALYPTLPSLGWDGLLDHNAGARRGAAGAAHRSRHVHDVRIGLAGRPHVRDGAARQGQQPHGGGLRR